MSLRENSVPKGLNAGCVKLWASRKEGPQGLKPDVFSTIYGPTLKSAEKLALRVAHSSFA